LLTQVLPYPPDSGPKVKTWNVIKYLSQKHEVTLVSFTRGDQSKDVERLRQVCARVETVPMTRGIVQDGKSFLRSLLTGQPWMMLRDDRAIMRQLVDRLSAEIKFDIAHADQLNMAQYALRVPGTKHLLDAHNALWQLYQRLALTLPQGPKRWVLERDWRLLKKYEGDICRKFDAVTVVSEEDRLALSEAMGSDCPATVIPITVDLDEFPLIKRTAESNHIISVGTMYWPPNIDGMLWFLNDIYPLVRQHNPEVEFDIIGARPPEAILAFDRLNIGVHVHGYVDDPTPYLENAGAMVVPLRAGSGMRVKILNALSQGIPIVTTQIGCEGIDVIHDQHLLIADTPAEFAAAVLNLLENPHEANRLGAAGRDLIQNHYDYRAASQRLDAIYSTGNVK
jgi:polysaccharide biosynthesis protein PslH